MLPAEVRWKADNYNNLMEQPTLFYALALTLALLGEGGALNTALAWLVRGFAGCPQPGSGDDQSGHAPLRPFHGCDIGSVGFVRACGTDRVLRFQNEDQASHPRGLTSCYRVSEPFRAIIRAIARSRRGRPVWCRVVRRRDAGGASMGSFLSERELAQLAPAEQAAFHSPVPTQMVSNGEFNPLPQTRQQRRSKRASRSSPTTNATQARAGPAQFPAHQLRHGGRLRCA